MNTFRCRWLALLVLALVGLLLGGRPGVAAEPESAWNWPAPTRTARPWASWWWLGSAVDPENLQRELQRYQEAGLGGVRVIPIYGG